MLELTSSLENNVDKLLTDLNLLDNTDKAKKDKMKFEKILIYYELSQNDISQIDLASENVSSNKLKTIKVFLTRKKDVTVRIFRTMKEINNFIDYLTNI